MTNQIPALHSLASIEDTLTAALERVSAVIVVIVVVVVVVVVVYLLILVGNCCPVLGLRIGRE